MYIQNSSPLSYPAHDDKALLTPKEGAQAGKNVHTGEAKVPELHGFSEKAVLIFEDMTKSYSPEDKAKAAEALSTIGKAAEFASINGFDSQSEYQLISQYFGNYSGVLSDEAIKKMIFSKLNNPQQPQRDFLQSFASALDEPLQSINIKV